MQLAKYTKELEAIKEQLQDQELHRYPPDVTGDYRILRFFLEHEQIVEDTVIAIRRFIKWRQENKVDELREEVDKIPFEQIRNYDKVVRWSPVNLMLRDDHGEVVVDEAGRPLSVEQSGKCDISQVMDKVSETEMMEMHISHLEKRSIILDELSRKKGELVQIVLIKDFRDADTWFPLKHPKYFSDFLSRAERMVKISRDFYPNTVGKAYIYRAPRTFGKIWKFFSTKILTQHHVNLTEFVDDGLVRIFGKQILPIGLDGLNTAKLSQLPR